MSFVPPVTQIDPRRIHRNNQLNFPDPKPAFDPLLAVNRVAHIIKTLVVNETINLVTLAECRSAPKLVFPNAAVQVICHSNIAVSYTHLRAHETRHDLVCRLL